MGGVGWERRTPESMQQCRMDKLCMYTRTPSVTRVPCTCQALGVRGQDQRPRCCIAVMFNILSQSLQVCWGCPRMRSTPFLLFVLGKLISIKLASCIFSHSRINKIYKSIGDVSTVDSIHRQVDKVVLAFKPDFVQLLDKHVPRVAVRDAVDHQSCDSLVLIKWKYATAPLVELRICMNGPII